MPQYEFVCTECEDKTPMTYLMKMNESNVKEVECWVCGAVAKKVVSGGSSFELKGGGWYAGGYSKSS